MDGNVVARPFQKFFNLEEITGSGEKLPEESFVVHEKMDGSLGILYWLDEKPVLATRGSFNSEQALKGTFILHQKYSEHFHKLDKTKTYLFEIIFPENRIVVDYGGMNDLILLAVIDNETGKDVEVEKDLPFIRPEKLDTADYTTLKDMSGNNKEGYVVRFESGLRVKVKFDEYVRLHRIVTGVTTRRVWDMLRNGEDFTPVLECVPDEFQDWLLKTKSSLEDTFNDIEQQCKEAIDAIPDGTSRKDVALKIASHPYRGIVFSMLDGKNYQDTLWRMLKPLSEKPFKQNEV